jgi:hypothetical protein
MLERIWRDLRARFYPRSVHKRADEPPRRRQPTVAVTTRRPAFGVEVAAAVLTGPHDRPRSSACTVLRIPSPGPFCSFLLRSLLVFLCKL